MLLAIDIGNTNITLGVFRKNRLIRRYTIPTKEKGYFAGLKKIVTGNRIEQAVISSVVPWLTLRLSQDLKRLLKRRPYIIGKEIGVPITNLYRPPEQVGQDRLLNAYAAIKLYRAPLIVVDFGTAITFDLISKNKEFLGGMILPGLRISLEALAAQTALLPKVKLQKPKEFIGRSTKNAILSGIIYGCAALTDNLLLKIKRNTGQDTSTIATGGDARLMSGFCRGFQKIDPDLTLKGLNLILKSAD